MIKKNGEEREKNSLIDINKKLFNKEYVIAIYLNKISFHDIKFKVVDNTVIIKRK